MVSLPGIVRVISGKGIIKIPEQYRRARRTMLYADVIRPPTRDYVNFTWNPTRHFYAHIAFCYGDYVFQEYDMNFQHQCWDVFTSQPSQNLLALICGVDNILDGFTQLAAGLEVEYIRENLIENFGFSTFIPDILRFNCYTDTAIRLVLTGEELEACSDEDGDATPPPPPPPPPTPVDAGTPVEVDPPYSGANDGGDTVPAPIDEPTPPPPPQGNPCTIYFVRFSYDCKFSWCWIGYNLCECYNRFVWHLISFLYCFPMAGSNRWFTYTSNDGTDWALFADESNTEAANPVRGQQGAPQNQIYKPPANLRPRYAVYTNQAGDRTIRVPILTELIYNALDNASTIPDPIAGGTATLALKRKRPELVGPIPTAYDTGLNDGDN